LGQTLQKVQKKEGQNALNKPDKNQLAPGGLPAQRWGKYKKTSG
jgi:hypothetical protein